MRPGGWGPHGGINAESLLLASLYHVRTYQKVSTWGLRMTLTFPVLAGGFFTSGTSWEAPIISLSLSLCIYLNHHMVHIKLI